MIWQPNILNNCYKLSGGYAPQTTHQGLCPWIPLGDFRSPDPLCPPPPNPGCATGVMGFFYMADVNNFLLVNYIMFISPDIYFKTVFEWLCLA